MVVVVVLDLKSPNRLLIIKYFRTESTNTKRYRTGRSCQDGHQMREDTKTNMKGEDWRAIIVVVFQLGRYGWECLDLYPSNEYYGNVFGDQATTTTAH